ncbi:MAG: sugar phosphate nucleotidyltransferase [Thermoleophilaceae bacterium]
MSNRAVILAGGKGSRLGPYTTVLPKPLLPIGDRAILDVVVRQLRDCGFTDLTLAVGYLAHLVRAVMGDGSSFGVQIAYHEESEPLGTIGALATIDGLDDTFLVMNGDILTAIDYAQLLDIHKESGNMLTLASHRRVVHIDYGVMHLGGDNGSTRAVVGFEEKPEMPCIVSMGIYVLEPAVLRYIEAGERLDLPDLVFRLLDAGEPVGSHLYDGFWLDIGRHDDYQRAIADFEQMRSVLLREPAADNGRAGSDPAAAPTAEDQTTQ